MGLAYRAVGWNRQKRIYDFTLWGGVLLYLGMFIGVGSSLVPAPTAETLLIRGLGTGAFLLLHVILCIGPLARLDRRFLPLLYNRRHMGVTMFLLALAHGVLSTVQYHALGNINPLLSLLTSNSRLASVSQFPFELLGLAGLAILFAMAVTSHDFWLANLTAPVWKALHMLVYPAYALLVMHVVLGLLQSERSPILAVLLVIGAATVLGLHLVAGAREAALDRPSQTQNSETDGAEAPWVDVCAVDDIPDQRARIVSLAGDRVAVFRYDDKISALSNACQHQNGPLGEGRVIDGCVTCPWHGYQYMPESGASPPPFEERVPTFRVRVRGQRVEVDPRPLPAGTAVEPARCSAAAPEAHD